MADDDDSQHKPDSSSNVPDEVINRAPRAWSVASVLRRLALPARMATWTLTLFSVLTVFAEHWWVADLLANLRMQWMIGIASCLLLTAATRQLKTACLNGVLLSLHVPWFLPCLSSSNPPSNPSDSKIVVMTANVLSRNHRFEDLESQFLNSNADVVAVLELSTPLMNHLEGDFTDVYPFCVRQPQDRGNFGIGLYSKSPMGSPKIVYLSNDGIPSATATVTVKNRRIHIVAIHTLPPIGHSGFRHRNAQLEHISRYVQNHRRDHPDDPVVVMGDLNLTPWSPIYDDFRQSSSLVPANISWTPTWYRLPLFPFGLVLDHVFTTGEFTCVDFHVGPDAGSDHRFLTVTLSSATND